MPEISLNALQNRIIDEFPSVTKGQAKAAAKRIAWRMVHAAEVDFYVSMRNLGIISDPTPREAIRNIERTAALA